MYGACVRKEPPPHSPPDPPPRSPPPCLPLLPFPPSPSSIIRSASSSRRLRCCSNLSFSSCLRLAASRSLSRTATWEEGGGGPSVPVCAWPPHAPSEVLPPGEEEGEGIELLSAPACLLLLALIHTCTVASCRALLTLAMGKPPMPLNATCMSRSRLCMEASPSLSVIRTSPTGRGRRSRGGGEESVTYREGEGQ